MLALHAETTHLVRAKPALALAWNVPDELPAIHTDPAKLRIVLKNLLDNAVKFTECGSITLTAAPRLGGVEVTVADTGAGIEPHALSYVFEAFRQGDGSPTRRHDGVGLDAAPRAALRGRPRWGDRRDEHAGRRLDVPRLAPRTALSGQAAASA